jgi:hypothetical protein
MSDARRSGLYTSIVSAGLLLQQEGIESKTKLGWAQLFPIRHASTQIAIILS